MRKVLAIMEKCFIMIDKTNTVPVHNEMLIHYREKRNIIFIENWAEMKSTV